jgi:DNA-binding NarL/FixJ family response regulator
MKKILVVDDEFDLLTTWRLVLQMEGYEVSTASNGLLALESVRANPPDLIITDWMMPTMRSPPTTPSRKFPSCSPAPPRAPRRSRTRTLNSTGSRFPSMNSSKSSRACSARLDNGADRSTPAWARSLLK